MIWEQFKASFKRGGDATIGGDLEQARRNNQQQQQQQQQQQSYEPPPIQEVQPAYFQPPVEPPVQSKETGPEHQYQQQHQYPQYPQQQEQFDHPPPAYDFERAATQPQRPRNGPAIERPTAVTLAEERQRSKKHLTRFIMWMGALLAIGLAVYFIMRHVNR